MVLRWSIFWSKASPPGSKMLVSIDSLDPARIAVAKTSPASAHAVAPGAIRFTDSAVISVPTGAPVSRRWKSGASRFALARSRR